MTVYISEHDSLSRNFESAGCFKIDLWQNRYAFPCIDKLYEEGAPNFPMHFGSRRYVSGPSDNLKRSDVFYRGCLKHLNMMCFTSMTVAKALRDRNI